jgi:tetratricopeptide (TPR) repeat protein
MSQVMERIMRLCPGAGIIVLTQEVDQYTTALLVEQGAHNIITKPISVASFTEKLAFTIAPQGKLSKLIEKGKKLLEAGGWGEALLVAEDILKQKPDSAVGFMIKGDAYLGLEMTARAEEMYQRAVKSAELYLAPLKRLAALYEQAGDADKQLECLRRLNEISPLNTQRILHIGELEIARGNTAVADEMFRSVMRLAQREASEFLSNLSGRIADICANPRSGHGHPLFQEGPGPAWRQPHGGGHRHRHHPGHFAAQAGQMAGGHFRVPARAGRGARQREPALQHGHGLQRRRRSQQGPERGAKRP